MKQPPENIFEVAKAAVRALRDGQWKYLSPRRAASQLANGDTEHFLSEGDYEALESRYSDGEFNQGRKTVKIPRQHLHVANILEEILIEAFKATHKESNTPYFLANIMVDEDDRLKIYAHDCDKIKFDDMIRRIDTYKQGLEKNLMSIEVNDTEYVAVKRDHSEVHKIISALAGDLEYAILLRRADGTLEPAIPLEKIRESSKTDSDGKKVVLLTDSMFPKLAEGEQIIECWEKKDFVNIMNFIGAAPLGQSAGRKV